ncbi:MAG: tetratricopeptide repeat protein [Vicinamibacteria bacterium]
MSKKPLADDRRRELATEAFAKLVRAAFKGEADKLKEALNAIESQFADEIDILDRARRFAAMNLSKDTGRTGRPKNTAERFLAGIISLNAGDLDAAEKDIEAVLGEEPKNADAHYALAVVRARREKVDEALASLKTACSLSPERRAQAPLDGEFASLLGNPGFEALTAA